MAGDRAQPQGQAACIILRKAAFLALTTSLGVLQGACGHVRS